MFSFQRKPAQESKDYKLGAVHFAPSADDIKNLSRSLDSELEDENVESGVLDGPAARLPHVNLVPWPVP